MLELFQTEWCPARDIRISPILFDGATVRFHDGDSVARLTSEPFSSVLTTSTVPSVTAE
jgi:hypothetical protein